MRYPMLTESDFLQIIAALRLWQRAHADPHMYLEHDDPTDRYAPFDGTAIPTGISDQDIDSLVGRLAEGHDKATPINIIFEGSPGSEGCRFVEVETDDGKSIKVGNWKQRDDGYYALRIEDLPV